MWLISFFIGRHLLFMPRTSMCRGAYWVLLFNCCALRWFFALINNWSVWGQLRGGVLHYHNRWSLLLILNLRGTLWPNNWLCILAFCHYWWFACIMLHHYWRRLLIGILIKCLLMAWWRRLLLLRLSRPWVVIWCSTSLGLMILRAFH